MKFVSFVVNLILKKSVNKLLKTCAFLPSILLNCNFTVPVIINIPIYFIIIAGTIIVTKIFINFVL